MTSQKPGTWSNRVSSLLPALITPTPDYDPTIFRKPAPSNHGSPVDTPPPPFYYERDHRASTMTAASPESHNTLDSSDESNSRFSFERSPAIGFGRDSSPPAHYYPEPISKESPLLQTEIHQTSFWDERVYQIDIPRPLQPQKQHQSVLPSHPPPVPQSQDTNMPADSVSPLGPVVEQPASEQLAQRNGSIDSDTSKHAGHSPTRKLVKQNPDTRQRSSSFQIPQSSYPKPGIKSSATATFSELRGRTVSSHPTLAITDTAGGQEEIPPLPSPQKVSPHSASQSPSKGRIRSWMPGGGRSRSNSVDVSRTGNMQAWIMSDEQPTEYSTSFLNNGEKVPELWNENGAVVIFLYPRSSGCGPSFKVPEFTISSSYIFRELISSDQVSDPARNRARGFGGRASLAAADAARQPTNQAAQDYSDDLCLYLPAAHPSNDAQLSSPGQGSDEELERLVAIRNLFAFLTGQPLVGTKTSPTIFAAFIQIASLLEEFGFIGTDGSGFGNAVDMSFGFYSDQMGLSDCRHSREKTVEALILGERMRSMSLYSEAFAHAAGKYSAIIDLRLPLFGQVSPQTRQRLERAHIDLVNRQQSVGDHLEQFDFPSMFAGIANSTSISELKQVRFKIWRNSFSRMRQFVLSHYKSTFGNWPPKASSKKNPFAESGLNRLVLKRLYSDMCALYDLLVDRENLTSRIIDQVPELSDAADKMNSSALRHVMSEYDRSRPPVLPPIPFDLPQIPSVSSIHATFNTLSTKDQNKFEKKLKEHEYALILNKAYNYDTSSIKLPFLDHFKEFELRESKGKMAQDLVDQRIGYWIFLYAVLQSLPMLVVDAPGLKYTEGSEYFLCEPPIGQPPWVEDGQVRKMWYEVAGGGGLVELSADAVMFSVEAIYHRSHCWLAAKHWEAIDGDDERPPPDEPLMSPLEPPRAMFQGHDGIFSPPTMQGPGTPSPPPGSTPPVNLRPRTNSPRRGQRGSRSSIAIGIEPVPIHQRSSSMGPRPPSSVMGSRSISVGNSPSLAPRGTTPIPATTSGTTFDDILGNAAQDKEKEKEKAAAAKKKSRFF